MIRNSLYISILVFACLSLTHCMTDYDQNSDDEIAAAADDTASAAPVTQSDAPPTDDLSGDLDDSSKVAANPVGDENSLESELDGTDDTAEQPLGDKVADEQQPDMNTEPLVDSTPIEQAPTETPAPAAPRTQITNIRYLANQAGGTVVVEASGPLSYHAHSENGNYVIDIDNAQLPSKLSHAYPMRDFSSSFANLQATQNSPNQARIVVQMKAGAAGEPIVQMEGNSLLVVPASVPTHAIAGNSGGKNDVSPSSPLAAHTLDEFLTGNQRFFGKPISVQTKDADIRDVVNFIAEESGANIVMSDDVKGRVSVKVRKVPWDQVLVSIMRTKQLGYVRQGNVIRISSMKELQEESDQALKMIETQRNMAPVKVKVIPVNYANVDELAKQVPAFLSKEGKAVVDARSNTILVTDRENVLEKVEQIIRSLDVQPNQVLIEGKIVEATESFSSFIGVNWGFSGAPTTLSQGGGYQGSPITVQPTLGSSPMDLVNNSRLFNSSVQIGTLDFFGSLNAALALEEKEGLVKVISSPRVAVMNKEKAEISQGGEQVTISTTVNAVSNDKTTQEKRTPMTLNLSVQPQITADNSVIMDVELKRQFPGAEVDSTTHAAPVNTRTAKTKILVRNGQTSVIGGIYQDQETSSDNGVPVLKDIPVLGWLFKSKARNKDKNELLIFLTPRILQQQVAQDISSAAAG